MVITFMLPGPKDIDISMVLDTLIIQAPGSNECLLIAGDKDSFLALAKSIEFWQQGNEQAKEE